MRESVQTTLFPVDKSQETARKPPSPSRDPAPKTRPENTDNTQHAELLLDFIGSGASTREEIMEEARRLKLDRRDVEELLEELRLEGLVYEPEYGVYKVV